MTLLTLALLSAPSDLELLTNGLAEKSSLISWSALPDTVIISAEAPEHPLDWAVENVLYKAARKQGKAVQMGFFEHNLTFHTVRTGVSYRQVSGGLPWIPKRTERTARFSVVVKLWNGFDVLQLMTLEGVVADTVSVDELEAAWVAGLSPQKNNSPEGRGLLEPVVTTLLLGGLLYVFYVFESK